MPKKKKGRTHHQPARTLPRQLVTGMADVELLLQHKRYDEARAALAELDRRYPNQPDVVGLLVNLAYERKDMQSYQHACERLLRLTPNEPDLTLGLAGAYMTNVRPALALRTFRRFLDRWPNHERADEVRATVAELETTLRTIVSEIGLEGDDAMDLAALHEEVQSLMNQGQWPQARRLAEQILQRQPDFIPVLNNLSQLYFADGQVDQAIATAQRVLALDPANYHALSNLARYLCLSGRIEEARQWAEQLKAVESDRTDSWVKKAEALSYLGDDEGVLDTLQRAERAGGLEPTYDAPLLYHLAAVADLRRGREDEARRHWRQALKMAPWLDVAQDNVDDLRKPVGERHAPWPFSFAQWIPRKTLDAFLTQMEPAARRDDEQALAAARRRFLQQHPEIARLVPLLLDRGDPTGREFALRVALGAETPELGAALRDFALSQCGPDGMRNQAAQAAQAAGLLPDGPVRMWLQGAWRAITLFGFEVHDEVSAQHGPQVETWQREATRAMREGDADRGERLIKQALELEPDAPDLWNNLAAAYSRQGREQDAAAIVRQIHERHPDYLFGRTNLALVHLQAGEIGAARALLEPLLSRKRFHVSEMSALMNAELELAVAQNNLDAAQSWLGLWMRVDPDNPVLAAWQRRLAKPGRRG